MNAPFPPAGPNPSAGDEPELRALLDADARRQPPVSPDLRAGVDRRVRRHRLGTAALAAPLVVVLLLGAAFLGTRSATDTTLDTAAQTTAQDGEDGAPAAEAGPDDPTVPVPAEGGGVDCGTIQLGPDRVDPETAPIDCFIEAFNAGTDARLVVVSDSPDGGTLTQTVVTAPNKQISSTVDGSLTVQLPSLGGFGSGGGGGLVEPEPEGPPVDCGTVSVTEETAATPMPPEVTSCLVELFTTGTGGGLTIIATDVTGAALTIGVDISAEQLLTVTFDGSITQTLPDGLTIPSDLTDKLPPNGFGLDELGLGDLGSEGLSPGGQPDR